VQADHTIGVHGRSHRRLAGLDEAGRFREIVTPGQILESRLGVPVKWFAYPFGNIDSIDAPALQVIASHYRFCCSGIRGINSSRPGPPTLLREQLALDMPLAWQQVILTGGLDFYYRKRIKRLKKLGNM